MEILTNSRIPKSLRKILKVILILTGSIFLLIIIASSVIDYFYKDKIIRYCLNELNKQLTVPLDVKKIDLTFLKTFPNVSIEFDDVIVKESKPSLINSKNIPEYDTLLKSDKIYLQLNLPEIIAGTYDIKILKVYNGFIRLYTDNSGESNYNILKKQSAASSGENTNFNFDYILLKDIDIQYRNKQDEIEFRGKAEKLKIIGDIRKESTFLDIQAGLNIFNFNIAGNTYITRKYLDLSSSLRVLNNSYLFNISNFNLQGVILTAKGNLLSGINSYIDLEVSGNKINIPKLINLLPDKFINTFNYNTKGTITLSCSIKGITGKTKHPEIRVIFHVNNGMLGSKTNNIKISNINFQGEYNNFSNKSEITDKLNLTSITAKLGSGVINGNAGIINLNEPTVNINIYNKLNLNDIKLLLNIDNIEKMEGLVECNININGKLPSSTSNKLSDYARLNYSGSVNIKNGNFKIKNLDYNFTDINGDLAIKNDIIFKNLDFKLHDNDFHINGTLFNGIPYFLCTNETANLNADISSLNLDLSRYFISTPDNVTSSQSLSRQLLFPENLNLDVRLSINNFKLHKFNAKWISCNIAYKPTIFTVKSVSFQSMSGDVSGNGLIVQDIDKNFITKSQLDVSKIDINLLFNYFNNFSQDIITYNNLSGRLSGTIYISSQWDNNLVINKDKLFLDGDINILEGQLIDFSYAKALSRFVSIDE